MCVWGAKRINQRCLSRHVGAQSGGTCSRGETYRAGQTRRYGAASHPRATTERPRRREAGFEPNIESVSQFQKIPSMKRVNLRAHLDLLLFRSCRRGRRRRRGGGCRRGGWRRGCRRGRGRRGRRRRRRSSSRLGSGRLLFSFPLLLLFLLALNSRIDRHRANPSRSCAGNPRANPECSTGRESDGGGSADRGSRGGLGTHA